ncbi:MAG: hypothetical protein V3R25_05960 [Nitrosomonadaceae bacterium]
MTKTEVKMILTVLGLCALAAISVSSCNSVITKAGGMKQVLIDAGKEIKEIKKEIDSDG